MNPEIPVLRAVHVLDGIFWLGGSIYSAVFVMPALSNTGPAMGAVIKEMTRRRPCTILPTVAALRRARPRADHANGQSRRPRLLRNPKPPNLPVTRE